MARRQNHFLPSLWPASLLPSRPCAASLSSAPAPRSGHLRVQCAGYGSRVRQRHGQAGGTSGCCRRRLARRCLGPGAPTHVAHAAFPSPVAPSRRTACTARLRLGHHSGIFCRLEAHATPVSFFHFLGLKAAPTCASHALPCSPAALFCAPASFKQRRSWLFSSL